MLKFVIHLPIRTEKITMNEALFANYIYIFFNGFKLYLINRI